MSVLELTAMSDEERWAMDVVERLRVVQKEGRAMPCPRCGRRVMDRRAGANALSRHADIMICPACGVDEALRDATGREPKPFSQWSAVKVAMEACPPPPKRGKRK